MIWQFLIAATIAVGFAQLGAMAVWVSVLSTALQAVLFLIVTAGTCTVLWLLWRRYKGPDKH